jgi:hypothetical protein
MPSSAERGAAGKSSHLDSPHDPRVDTPHQTWPRFCFSIARVLLIQVVLLVALSSAFVAYLNWSSAKTFAEFLSAGSVLTPSNPALQSIRGLNPCDRGA